MLCKEGQQGCPILGGVQSQVGWGPGQPDLKLEIQGVDQYFIALGYEMGRLVALPVVGGWNSMILEVPSNPTIL